VQVLGRHRQVHAAHGRQRLSAGHAQLERELARQVAAVEALHARALVAGLQRRKRGRVHHWRLLLLLLLLLGLARRRLTLCCCLACCRHCCRGGGRQRARLRVCVPACIRVCVW
jgi:hypothetical protein